MLAPLLIFGVSPVNRSFEGWNTGKQAARINPRAIRTGITLIFFNFFSILVINPKQKPLSILCDEAAGR